MGDPKKTGKKYFTPKKPWDKIRIEEERKLIEGYGLKNKKEIWLSETFLKKKRQNARKLLALPMEEKAKKEKELLESLKRMGLAKKTATLDDVLDLKTEELLERRLQTIVWRKGLANTVKQARQFITHGHIAIKGKKVSVPSYIVKVEEEKDVSFYGKEIPLKPLEPKEKKKAPKEETKESAGEEEIKEDLKEEKAEEEKKKEEKEEVKSEEKIEKKSEKKGKEEKKTEGKEENKSAEEEKSVKKEEEGKGTKKENTAFKKSSGAKAEALEKSSGAKAEALEKSSGAKAEALEKSSGAKAEALEKSSGAKKEKEEKVIENE